MDAKPAAPADVFVHPQGLCETSRVGARTRIWAFAHVLSGATIGVDCNICDHVFIEDDVVVGDLVTVKSGVQLWNGVSLGDDVFVGPNATFSNDKYPRSKQYQTQVSRTEIGRGASIGAGAVILPSSPAQKSRSASSASAAMSVAALGRPGALASWGAGLLERGRSPAVMIGCS